MRKFTGRTRLLPRIVDKTILKRGKMVLVHQSEINTLVTSFVNMCDETKYQDIWMDTKPEWLLETKETKNDQ
ncbi:MAG: hypothetical protein COA52_01110 [Hyphomicrobiales bacterium]|nr:MAG: hypothetical protein COA52_00020 [Hyphomicrobiales bacterium]PCJ96839.1 MAG: hypothetical protein COA52_01110 [Hyphomicrobiales bacterium]